jgi:dipeptidyl aminopeptidase/acylaminoacyl peptidase
MGRVRAVCAAIALLAATDAAAQTASRPPVEAFAQLPDLRQPVLSPDGKYLAVLQARMGRPVLVFYTVGASDAPPVVRSVADWTYGNIKWAKNDRLVAYMTKDEKLGWDYVEANHLVSWGREISYDAAGDNIAILFRHNPFYSENISMSGVKDLDLDDPDNVYVPYHVWSDLLSPSEEALRSKNGHDNEPDLFRSDMFKVNVRTGDDEKVIAGDYSTRDWYMDGHGHVLARLDRASNSVEEHLKVYDDGSWRDIRIFDASEGHGSGIQGVSDDGKALVRSVYNKDSRAILVRTDLATGTDTQLYNVPNFDIDDVIEDDWTGRVVGAAYDADSLQFVYFDPAREALQRGLEAAFPGKTAYAASSDVARDLVVVAVEGPRNPLAYYMLDRTTHAATLLGKTYPHLSESDLGEMKPYPYKARDGLDIPAYLTLPPGRAPKNLPAVIFPHGGPDARDDMSFDYEAQFMANRGYAVLQPNFRGSSGYGEKFTQAGLRQWGLKMQDDISDGVKKLIADGIVNPKRVCIVGASYGGYAALAGATFTPDLYACAVSFAGISDLPKMLHSDRANSNSDAREASFWESRIGSTDANWDQLAATSPARHADQVKCPILLLHGDGDTTVPIAQSEIEEAALKSAGKNVQFVRLEGDDHYSKLGATRVRTLKEIESFLAANIGI